MSSKITQIFDYMDKKTPIHRLDPRSKGMFVITFGTLTLIFQYLPILVILFLITISIVALGKMGKPIIDAFEGVSILISLLLIINSFFVSFNFALIAIFRVIILINVITFFFQTTDPERLMQSMVKLRFPYYLGFSLSLSFRFIPTMARELETVQNAQKSRGHKLGEGNFFKKIQSYFPIIIPLIMNSIRRAFHVAEALETRGFGATKRPTFYYPLKFKLTDWGFILANVFILILGIIIKINPSLLPAYFYWSFSF